MASAPQICSWPDLPFEIHFFLCPKSADADLESEALSSKSEAPGRKSEGPEEISPLCKHMEWKIDRKKSDWRGSDICAWIFRCARKILGFPLIPSTPLKNARPRDFWAAAFDEALKNPAGAYRTSRGGKNVKDRGLKNPPTGAYKIRPTGA